MSVGNEPKPQIPRNLLIIDEAVREEYSYIEVEDTCFYLWERMSNLWSSGKCPDYTQYPVNSLIANLQISPALKDSQPTRYYWKDRAIKYAAEALAAVIPDVWREINPAFVPVPPSKTKDHPEYDARLTLTLKSVRPKLRDIRELIVLNGGGFDSKQKGLRPDERALHYSIDEDVSDPEPRVIVLVDDLLTTGCHYKAVGSVLKRRFPEVAIYGLFLARAVRPPNDEIFDFDS